MFLTPSKISLPSAMIFSSAHHPAGMCLSAYSGGAGGGGSIGPSSSAHPAMMSPKLPMIASIARLVIFIAALKLLSFLQISRIKKTLFFRASRPRSQAPESTYLLCSTFLFASFRNRLGLLIPGPGDPGTDCRQGQYCAHPVQPV